MYLIFLGTRVYGIVSVSHAHTSTDSPVLMYRCADPQAMCSLIRVAYVRGHAIRANSSELKTKVSGKNNTIKIYRIINNILDIISIIAEIEIIISDK